VIHHVALETRREDAPALAAFFGLLGFQPVEPPPSLADRALWLESKGARPLNNRLETVGGQALNNPTQVHVLYADEPVVMPAGHVAVIAPDYEEALQRLRAAGFEPSPRAEHWGSPRCFVRAPGGHRVEVMAFPPV
jgi:catechol 2,3-dioxygenase-like lactoylglutathione lyase family enzyme